MVLPILSLLSGLTPLQKKIIGYGLLAVSLLFVARWYSNRVYTSGKRDGRIEMSKEIVKAKQSEWAVKEKAINDEKLAADQYAEKRQAEIDAQLAELGRQRQNNKTALDQFVKQLNKERDQQNESIYSIPSAQLDGAIRTLSRQLSATAK